MKSLVVYFYFILCLQCAWAQQRTRIDEDIFWNVTPQSIVFGNDSVELKFNPVNGEWESMLLSGVERNVLLTSSLPDFKIEDKWMVQRAPDSLLDLSVSTDPLRKKVTLNFRWEIGDYVFSAHYALQPCSPVIERSSSVTLKASSRQGKVRLTGFSFPLTMVLNDEKECTITIPGPFFPHTFTRPFTPFDSLKTKAIQFHSAPDAGFGVFVLDNRKIGKTIALWMNTSGEVNYTSYLKGDDKSILFCHDDLRYYYLSPGLSVTSDTQIIQPGRDPVHVLNRFSESCQQTIPVDEGAAPWVKEMVILEIFPEYFKGGFKEIASKLSFYKKIGFNTIYLMPHWKGGYSPVDLFEVEPRFGTSGDLKDLVKTAHNLGMKVLFDMVIHGFNEESMVPKEKPQMFVHKPEGGLALHPTWKSISTDWASEAYQNYMTDLVLHDLKEYNIDGYRIDAASFKGPNWDPSIPYPAYRSGTAAPELMKKMLAAMREKKEDAIFLNEVFGPVFYHVSNLSHDNQTEAVQMLMEKMEKGLYSAEDYKYYLQHVYAALPPGVNRVFFARNHDTSWFYHFNGYSPLYFCFEAVHAFFGIPEVFAGDPGYRFNPDDDKEIFIKYNKLFQTRHRYPELIRGEIVLDKISADDPEIFTGIREEGNNQSIIVINMSDQVVSTRVAVQNRILGTKLTATDVMTGRSISLKKTSNSFSCNLAPYQIVIVR